MTTTTPGTASPDASARFSGPSGSPGESPIRPRRPRDAAPAEGGPCKAGNGSMTIEIRVPENWAPGVTLAMRQLLQAAIDNGLPLVTTIRQDAAPEDVRAIAGRIRRLVSEAGLAA